MESLRAWLESDRVVVIQDGEPISARSIAARADNLIARLGGVRGSSVAVATGRVDRIIAALVACQTAGKELFLLRQSFPMEHPVWKSWGVECLLDDELAETILPFGNMRTPSAGIVLMTSGTIGKPKVVFHDLEKLMGRIRHQPKAGNDVRWLLTYHPASFAGMQVLLTTLCSQHTLITMNRQTVPLLARAAFEHQATHISGTPTFWRSFLLDVTSRSDTLQLQQITLGGEVVDQHTLDQLQAAFPDARISHIYASTEAGALFAVSDGRAGFPARWLEEGVDGIRLRIRDEVLEVLSPRAMRAYLKEGLLAQEFQEGGWIHTGDMVESTHDRVMFRGRVDNLINVGGAKVTPEEVEAALLRVSCVRESRVYGVRNPITGALVAADVVLKGESPHSTARQEIMTQLFASLEAYKVPRIMHFVDAIEISKVGKKTRYVHS